MRPPQTCLNRPQQQVIGQKTCFDLAFDFAASRNANLIQVLEYREIYRAVVSFPIPFWCGAAVRILLLARY